MSISKLSPVSSELADVVANDDELSEVTDMLALTPSTAAAITLLSPVSVKLIVDDEASVTSPISKSKVLLSPVVVILSVTVSQSPDDVELQSKSTVFELPVNTQVPV